MKKFLKFLAVTLAAVFFFGCAAWAGINLHVKAQAGKKIYPAREAEALEADCGLILGAGLREDGSPCDMLEERLEIGAALYKAGAVKKLLMSGGKNEVAAMKDYAVSAGVPEEDILLDPEGVSTWDSMYRTAHVFEAESVIVVSQPYHLYRAVYLGNAFGLESCGAAPEEVRYELMGWYKLRETLARIKDWGKVTLLPVN